MVKADVRRDYYADLGLGPSAESEDIKKQFRKLGRYKLIVFRRIGLLTLLLALKYHPDRNPGKEVEFIAKFQAIQAAHEILSDPQQRLRYDTDRLRAGYGRQYAAHARANTSRRTHASHTTASAKPQPFSARAQYANTGPSTGAQRYASYAKAAPQQPWEKKNDDGQTRADAFRGFQGMKNGSPNMSGWSSFDPRTGRSGTTRANGTSTGQTPRTKSAYEYFKASSKPTEGAGTPRSQTTRRKNGFAPGTAGGDEPMAANTSAYTSTPRDSRHSGYFFDNSVPSPTAKRTDGPDLERVRNQYANASGEKTFFSSAWLGRDNARRTSRTNPPSPTPDSDTNRHRSVSPSHLKANRNRHYAPSASPSDADDDDDDDDDTDDDPYERNNASPAPKPKAVPKSRLRRHHYQKPADPRDWSSGTGEHFFPTQTVFRGPGPSYYQSYYYHYYPNHPHNHHPWDNRYDYRRPNPFHDNAYRCTNWDYLKRT